MDGSNELYLSTPPAVLFRKAAVPATILSLGYACVIPLVFMGLLWNMGLHGLWLNSSLISAVLVISRSYFFVR